jgi:hypothetical protein
LAIVVRKLSQRNVEVTSGIEALPRTGRVCSDVCGKRNAGGALYQQPSIHVVAVHLSGLAAAKPLHDSFGAARFFAFQRIPKNDLKRVSERPVTMMRAGPNGEDIL